MTPPTVTAWAIRAPEWHICRGILNTTIRRTRKESIDVWSFSEFPWKRFYRQGYRCVKVQITETEEGK